MRIFVGIVIGMLLTGGLTYSCSRETTERFKEIKRTIEVHTDVKMVCKDGYKYYKSAFKCEEVE